MPKQMRFTMTSERHGITSRSTATLSADKEGGVSKSIPAAKEGDLTTRTDDDTGSLTMDPGHGITTAAKLDLYWTDPTTGAQMSRVNMTVGTVATNVVPIDGGSGDVLPAAATAIRAMVPVVETLNIDGGAAGANIVGMDNSGPRSCAFVFFEGATLIAARRLNASAAGGVPNGDIWANGYTGANPFATLTAEIDTVALSHGELTAQVLECTILYN